MSSPHSAHSSFKLFTPSEEALIARVFGDSPLSEVRDDVKEKPLIEDSHKASSSTTARQNERSDQRGVKHRMRISNLLNDIDEEVPVPRKKSKTVTFSTVTEARKDKKAPKTILDDVTNDDPRDAAGQVGLPICHMCTQEFKYHYQLRDHFAHEHGYPPYACPHCSYKAEKLVNMKRHVRILHDVPNRRYHCYACKFFSVFGEEMRTHVRLHHSRCPYCDSPFDRLSAHERMCALRPTESTETK